MIEKAILERLEALVQLSLPSVTLPDKETNEIKVLRLCDYNQTREDIAKAIGITQNQVDVLLNSLRKSGKIRSVPKDGTTVYIRLRR
ncbi:MAG: hypothetical protein IH847_07985 [Acidobacteria bacterium]|nr:hypothetical protein [Acidobacteriota bacterium]